jgi:hypothetical protein
MTIIAAEEALYFRDYGSGLAGFGEITVATDFERLLSVRRQSVRSERDDGDMLGLRIVLQDLSRFPAIDYRDRDIHEDEVGLGCSGLGYSLFPIPCFSHFVAEVLENGGVHDTVVFVVLNKQNHLTRLAHLTSHGYCNLSCASKYLTTLFDVPNQ